ncbi:Protein of unknown function [Gryllus bimaculatus]|nr:Protein of unknown function [Gryllus bimaculatus]
MKQKHQVAYSAELRQFFTARGRHEGFAALNDRSACRGRQENRNGRGENSCAPCECSHACTEMQQFVANYKKGSSSIRKLRK